MIAKVKTTVVVFLLGMVISIGSVATHACSIFQLGAGEATVTGYNFDWFKPLDACAFINPRGDEKTALAPGVDTPISWTARYGSVTFSGFGRDFPVCGRNEAGLVVVQAWLGSTVYPEIDARPSLCELQWIQYQLDTAGSVQEVIASDEKVRISIFTLAPLHFFVSDSAGESAIIEFLDGELVVSTGADMPVKMMVNKPYQTCLTAYNEKEAAENRFVVGANLTRQYGSDSLAITDYAFKMLDSLQRDGTRWAVVFDAAHGGIYYRVAGAGGFEVFNCNNLEYDCGNTNLQHFLVDDLGDVEPGFTTYDASLTRAMILGNGANIPNAEPGLFEDMANYSAAAGCGG